MQCSQHTHLDCDFALDLDWDLDLDLLFLGSDLDLERDRDLDLDLERSRDLLINEEAHQLLAHPLNLKLNENSKVIRGAKILHLAPTIIYLGYKEKQKAMLIIFVVTCTERY
jgi:hypothetical protein